MLYGTLGFYNDRPKFPVQEAKPNENIHDDNTNASKHYKSRAGKRSPPTEAVASSHNTHPKSL
jgi:hypothetical protein